MPLSFPCFEKVDERLGGDERREDEEVLLGDLRVGVKKNHSENGE